MKDSEQEKCSLPKIKFYNFRGISWFLARTKQNRKRNYQTGKVGFLHGLAAGSAGFGVEV